MPFHLHNLEKQPYPHSQERQAAVVSMNTPEYQLDVLAHRYQDEESIQHHHSKITRIQQKSIKSSNTIRQELKNIIFLP